MSVGQVATATAAPRVRASRRRRRLRASSGDWEGVMADAPVTRKDIDALHKDGKEVHQRLETLRTQVEELRTWAHEEEKARLKDDDILNKDRARQTAELNRAFDTVESRFKGINERLDGI